MLGLFGKKVFCDFFYVYKRKYLFCLFRSIFSILNLERRQYYEEKLEVKKQKENEIIILLSWWIKFYVKIILFMVVFFSNGLKNFLRQFELSFLLFVSKSI